MTDTAGEDCGPRKEYVTPIEGLHQAPYLDPIEARSASASGPHSGRSLPAAAAEGDWVFFTGAPAQSGCAGRRGGEGPPEQV